MSVQKTDYVTLASSEIYSHAGPYPTVNNGFFPWFGIFQDRLVTYNQVYNFSIAK